MLNQNGCRMFDPCLISLPWHVGAIDHGVDSLSHGLSKENWESVLNLALISGTKKSLRH